MNLKNIPPQLEESHLKFQGRGVCKKVWNFKGFSEGGVSKSGIEKYILNI